MRRVLSWGLGLMVLLLAGAGFWLYAPDKPRAALEAAYAPAPSQFIEILGVRLHVRDTGPRGAPAVLLIHGFGSSLHTWEDVAQGLSDTRRVVRLDLPGFGLTGADPTDDYTDERAHRILLALLDQLGIATADVVGSSMGGRIAWSLAAAHPARVRRLVLMAPDGFASMGRSYGATPRKPLMAYVLPYTLPEPLLQRMLRSTYGDPERMTDGVVSRTRDMLLAPGVRQAIIERMGDNVLTPPEARLRGLAAPTLLLWGEKDRAIPVSHAADYLRELPDARLVALPGIGHVPMEEAPAATVAAIRAFLD
jgi:pimeloyl-ACP methyl ester carboxylesterase